ncbi:MAG: NUDIX domain-containing protein [Deltaproteobacteria bacterium]|nr:NUDIX domain-containing protein [Deltaproteobacteria bacterium]
MEKSRGEESSRKPVSRKPASVEHTGLGQEPQTLIVVDDEDHVVRYVSRSDCHSGDGLRHRGVAILLHNSKAEVLLQKRKHDLFDNLWDLTGATHPLHLDNRDETYEESGIRCLKAEWGIELPLHRVLAFTYLERDKNRCENEYCVVLAGKYDGELNPNRNHIYEFRWVTWSQLVRELAQEPDAFTAWLRKAVENLEGSPL